MALQKAGSILMASVLISLLLIVTFMANRWFGQTLSSIVAGVIVALFLTVLSWLILCSELTDHEKRNALSISYVIVCIALFAMAGAFGGGSIFGLSVRFSELGAVILGGGIFGLQVGMSMLFDQALLNKKNNLEAKILRTMALLAFAAFMLVWYFPLENWLFIASIVVSRLVFSLLFFRIHNFDFQSVSVLGVFSLLLMFLVLPIAAFFSN